MVIIIMYFVISRRVPGSGIRAVNSQFLIHFCGIRGTRTLLYPFSARFESVSRSIERLELELPVREVIIIIVAIFGL